MKLSPFEKAAFLIYENGWRLAIPFLKKNPRLADGYKQRILAHKPPADVDLWIQSASVGESFLTLTLLANLKLVRPVKILLTANTRQGLEILQKGLANPDVSFSQMDITTAYFPFDRPSLMKTMVNRLKPRVMVLVESEIWPGLLRALKEQGCRILVVNGRMTAKSARRYLKWPVLWRNLKPHRVLAMSKADAHRFAAVFGNENVAVMPNIKFDQLPRMSLIENNPLQKIIPKDKRFIVLGSTREEEETDVLQIIRRILSKRNDVVFGLFPRHMHRLEFWENTLQQHHIAFAKRSKLTTRDSSATIILWDVFGELQSAYTLSKAIFVGGSLAPLGGQNFLEALSCGIIPVIGPYWDNFSWVGDEIIHQDLLHVAHDRQMVAERLLMDLDAEIPVEKVRRKALAYIEERSGGTRVACAAIEKLLSGVA